MLLFRTSFISFLALATLLQLPETSANTSSNNKGHVRVKRKMVKGIERRWPNSIVPYTTEGLSPSLEKKVTDAIEHWSTFTCLTFKMAKKGERKIQFITSERSRSSTFGYNKTHNTVIELHSTASLSTGTVIHEIGHALGFYHEHARPDRDDYVTVLKPEGKFAKWDYMNTHGMPYDYLSIMHYPTKYDGEYAILPKTGTYRPIRKIKPITIPQNSSFLRPRQRKFIVLHRDVTYNGETLSTGRYRIKNSNDTHVTVEKKYGPIIGYEYKPAAPIDPKQAKIRRRFEQIGQRQGLSFLDIKLANHVYRCSAHCYQKACPGEGFLAKNCVCQCDSGQVDTQRLWPCHGIDLPTPPPRPKCRKNSPHDHDDCEAWAAKGDCSNAEYTKWMMEYCPSSCGECVTIKKFRPKKDKVERQWSTSFTMKCSWTAATREQNSQVLVRYRAPGTSLKYNVCSFDYRSVVPRYWHAYAPNQKNRAHCKVTYKTNQPSGELFFTLSNLTLNDTGTYFCTYKINKFTSARSVDVTVNKTEVYNQTLLNTTTVTGYGQLKWSTYKLNKNSRGWQERSFTRHGGRTGRGYSVCDTTRTGPIDNWVRTPYIPLRTDQRIEIDIRYSVRNCTSMAYYIQCGGVTTNCVLTPDLQCKESLRVYSHTVTSQGTTPTPGWDESEYEYLGTATATHVWHDETDSPPINRAKYSLPVGGRGLYVAIRDSGACVNLYAVTVTAVCDTPACVGRADCRVSNMVNEPSGDMLFTLSNLAHSDTGTYYCTYKLNSSSSEASVDVSVCDTGCSSGAVDMVIILDASASILYDNNSVGDSRENPATFRAMLHFIENLLKGLSWGRGSKETQIAVVLLSEVPQVRISLAGSHAGEPVPLSVWFAPEWINDRYAAGTNMHTALEVARKDAFIRTKEGMREKSTKYVLVLTDGWFETKKQFLYEARKLRSNVTGSKILAVQVDVREFDENDIKDTLRRKNIRSLVDQPYQDYVFSMDTDGVNEIRRRVWGCRRGCM